MNESSSEENRNRDKDKKSTKNPASKDNSYYIFKNPNSWENKNIEIFEKTICLSKSPNLISAYN